MLKMTILGNMTKKPKLIFKQGNKMIKNLKLKNNTAEITVYKDNDPYDTKDILALAVLLGDYNAHGKNMEINKYKEAQRRFFDIIEEVKQQI